MAHKLTDAAVKQAKPRDKAYKLVDGDNLFLLIQPDGKKYWRMRYRYDGSEKMLALGVYPEVSLKEARAKRDTARKQLVAGVNPVAARRAERASGVGEGFGAMALEWLDKQRTRWSKVHYDKTHRMLERDLFPYLADRPPNKITPPELLGVLRRIEARGAADTAHRAKWVCGQIMRYAVATGRAERDPSADLRGALAPVVGGHMAAITEPKQIGALLRAIHGYSGSPAVRAALRLAPLVFVRPGELRTMEWAAIDWAAGEWRFQASKTDTAHIVPLSRQALDILRELQPLTGRGQYVFPSGRGGGRSMSDGALRTALGTLGYGETMSAHGFRAMARTLLDEVLGYRVDWIEHQLAHAVKDSNGRAYNRTAHLDGRRAMMQGWADYLDTLRLAQ